MKQKKLFILFLIVISMIVPDIKCLAVTSGYWTDSGIRATSFSNYGPDYIKISSAAELGLLAYNVNNGNSYSGYTISLQNDIDLSGHYFTPIGSSSNPFRGVFDGRGFSIKNIIIKDSNECVSFIRYLGVKNVLSGEIKNLTLTGSIDSTGSNGAAGIVGVNFGYVTNCLILTTITSKYQASAISTYNYGIISNCVFAGELNSSGMDTGVVYHNYGTITYSYFLSCPYGTYKDNEYEGSSRLGVYEFQKSGTTCIVQNPISYLINFVSPMPPYVDLVLALNTGVGSNTHLYCNWRSAVSTVENSGYPVIEKIIRVTISWGDLSFNCIATWDTASRRNVFSWQRRNSGSDRIYIENSSACSIKATATYTPLSGYESISGAFKNSSGTQCTYIVLNPDKIDCLFLYLSGSPSNYTSLNNTSVGTVTISISRE